MERIWSFICKWSLWFFYVSHIRQAHAYFMGWLYDRQYRSYPVKSYPSVSALAGQISAAVSFYRPDGPERLWDSISPPGRFQYFLDHGGPGKETAVDCDDFANYEVHALLASKLPDVANPRLLLVFWMQENNLPTGHAVCLYEAKGKYAYMDYGWPSYRDSIKQIAQLIVERYNGRELLIWAELNPETFHADVVKRNP